MNGVPGITLVLQQPTEQELQAASDRMKRRLILRFAKEGHFLF
jgi:hypothetical protein